MLEGPVFEGPVFEGPVFEGPVFEGPVGSDGIGRSTGGLVEGSGVGSLTPRRRGCGGDMVGTVDPVDEEPTDCGGERVGRWFPAESLGEWSDGAVDCALDGWPPGDNIDGGAAASCTGD